MSTVLIILTHLIFFSSLDFKYFYYFWFSCYFFRESFNFLPALNLAIRRAGISIFSFGFCGLTPFRACLSLGLKVPKLVILTACPFFSFSIIKSKRSLSSLSICFLLKV